MNCKATSIPPAKVSWLKDGNPVEEDNDHVIASNGSLVITNLVTKDSGVYQCNRDHDGGWSDFAEATLTVMGKVKLRGIHNNQVNANLHKPQKIRCDFEGHKPITVTWKKEVGCLLIKIE
ncbi:Hemicentin-1 [Desmophyllum pertusum]|uniref:Hemicentin-1 n=1 Tax=Desmophyllum pertusum TaxID=174260 RepID=A0A9X0CJQ9_9CNID|nr:Hemicentin-1 [Desmophyllum pertusum]